MGSTVKSPGYSGYVILDDESQKPGAEGKYSWISILAKPEESNNSARQLSTESDARQYPLITFHPHSQATYV